MKAVLSLPLWIAVFVAAGCVEIEQARRDTDSSQGRYGAIAYSHVSENWRFRWNVRGRSRAVRLVLSDCGDLACRVVVTFGPEHCGSFSLGENRVVGVGIGRSPKVAEDAARADCQRKGGTDCKVAPGRCNP